MKIYFAGSIRGGSEDRNVYHTLIKGLQEFGQVLTEHVGDPELTDSGEHGLSDEEIFRRDVSWIHEADILVAEVTKPSLGVGYEIGLAESLDKPAICLYRQTGETSLSAMVAGNPRLKVHVYEDVEKAVSFVKEFVRDLEQQG